MKKRGYFEEHWSTPDYVYESLNREFNFDFDPYPVLDEADINDSNDGTVIDWGKRNYVNPPYKKDAKKEFVIKGIVEMDRGNLSALMLPVSTSTELFHDFVYPNATEIRFVRRRIKFIGKNSKGEIVSSSCGMADSMIIIFDPKDRPEVPRMRAMEFVQ